MHVAVARRDVCELVHDRRIGTGCPQHEGKSSESDQRERPPGEARGGFLNIAFIITGSGGENERLGVSFSPSEPVIFQLLLSYNV